MQKLVARYGWQPDWETPADIEAILAVAQNRPGPPDQALERAAIYRYCTLWYAACRSEEPFEQRAAFSALYPYILRIASYQVRMRYNVHREAAEPLAADCAQIALENIWKALDTLKDSGTFLSWVRTFVVRAIINTMKSEPVDSPPVDNMRKLEDTTQALNDEPEGSTEPAEPQAEKDEEEIEEVLRRCLRSKNQQQVIIEIFLNNRAVKQVAELLGKTPGNVSKLKHDALNSLRKCGEMRAWMEKKQGQPTKENVQHLLRAVAAAPDTQLTCAIVEQWLPSYVADEVAGEDVAAKYPDVKRHLDLCPECEPLYLDLLELALAEAADAIPLPAVTPKPDLSFLPAPSPREVARHLVNAVAQKTLDALAPNALATLAGFSDLFFKRVEGLGGRLPAYRGAPAILGSDHDPATAALLTLTVAHLTAQRVAETVTAQELQTQIAHNRLPATLLPIAEQVALESGMDQAQAQTFARIYTEEVQQDAGVWLVLVDFLR